MSAFALSAMFQKVQLSNAAGADGSCILTAGVPLRRLHGPSPGGAAVQAECCTANGILSHWQHIAAVAPERWS